jgi:hypothetical protein
MKRLFILGVFAVCGWYGWTHRDTLFARHETHEAVIENNASSSIERFRLTVDGQTLVKESIASNEKAVIPFEVKNDSDFKLIWEWGDKPGERRWHGGMIAKGAMLQRHVFQIDDAGNVRYYTEPKGPAAPN